MHDLSAFESLAATWDAVNAQASALPFLESKFLKPLLAHADIREGYVALGHNAAREPVAAALLERKGSVHMETLQPSQLPLGAWLAPAGSDLTQLTGSLLKALPLPCLAIGITQLDPLFCSRPPQSSKLRTMDYIDTAWVEVDGSFDTFWEARGKNLKSNLRKQRNRLAQEQTDVRFEVVTQPADVHDAVAHFSRLESAGWKGEIGTAVSTDTAQGKFYADMMKAFCEVGRGEIWMLYFGDRVVAVDLCIEGGGSLVILKTAYDNEFKSFSPAFLLKQDAFKRVFDEKRVARIEFYGRVMEWHTRWTDRQRGLYHANGYRWAWVPHLRDLARKRNTAAAVASAGEAEPEAKAPATADKPHGVA